MARKRQIDPEYPFEQEIAQLSISTRYFYILSWCHMDDANGVLPYDLFKLKGQTFPTDNVDIRAIIQELIDQRRLFPFEANGKRWLWCPTMLKHQSIKHPSKQKYPDPPKTLREDYASTTVVRSLSRVELSRVENKEQRPPAVSLKLKALLREVAKSGLNITRLISKFKKDTKVDWLPDEVLEKVCEYYLKNKKQVIKPWPWFVKAIQTSWETWNAEQNMREGKAYKKAPIPKGILDLIKSVGK